MQVLQWVFHRHNPTAVLKDLNDFWLFSSDYIAQGLTMLLFLYVIFKLARQDVKGLALTQSGQFNNVNNFREHVFSGDLDG